MPDHSACEIYLVRHGETEWNFQERIQGLTDIPLNATGISQAMHLGKLLSDVPFSAAYASDLSRAQQTAELILKPRSLPVIPIPALRERSAGALEGLSKHQFEEKIRPFLLSEEALKQENYIQSAWHPEIETTQSVLKRVTDFLFSLTHSFADRPLLIVSHGGVIRSFLDYLSFAPRKRWVVQNCGYIKLKVNQQQLQLLDHHRVGHKEVL